MTRPKRSRALELHETEAIDAREWRWRRRLQPPPKEFGSSLLGDDQTATLAA